MTWVSNSPLGSTAPSIAGFALDRLIGEGGFGQVWHAVRDADAIDVAIKILHFELVSSNDAMVRFQRELAAIDRLQHRNVVRAFSNGALIDGRPYVVLEYLDGPSLREVIRDRGAFGPHEMLDVFGPLCEALTVAHAASLVHRDIKASNVVLAHDAKGIRPVLLDFGLVKLIDQAGPGLTSSRTMLGTPTAMAPEQMRGEPVDARTDIYALGLLAYHMLTGVPAFTAGGGAIKSYLQLHGPRPRPSSKIDIDPAIDLPVMKALAPTPADRYPSATELFDALRSAVNVRTSGVITIPRPRSDDVPDATLVTPVPGAETGVIVLYIESDREQVLRARAVAIAAGMTIAISAPDSILAVAAIGRCDLGDLKSQMAVLSRGGKIAIGLSRATLQDDQVDGPALDVETWAPHPLEAGLWISPAV